jgi:hypothetical protein
MMSGDLKHHTGKNVMPGGKYAIAVGESLLFAGDAGAGLQCARGVWMKMPGV